MRVAVIGGGPGGLYLAALMQQLRQSTGQEPHEITVWERNAADDLVQDTLVRALRSEHLFHGGEIRSWLYTILTNLNRNRLRSLSRRPTLTSIDDNDAHRLDR